MKTSINQRLKVYFEYKKLKNKEIANRIPTSEQTVSNILNDKTEPKAYLIQSILNAFEDLNAEWLTRGVGDMLKDGNSGNVVNEGTFNYSESATNVSQSIGERAIPENYRDYDFKRCIKDLMDAKDRIIILQEQVIRLSAR